MHADDKYTEQADGFSGGHEIRVGGASWDRDRTSVKFTTTNSLGHVTRSGEVPIEALPQMVKVVQRYLKAQAS